MYYPQHLHYFKLLKLKYVLTNFVIIQIMCTAVQNSIFILLLFINSREYGYTISKTHTDIYIQINTANSNTTLQSNRLFFSLYNVNIAK